MPFRIQNIKYRANILKATNADFIAQSILVFVPFWFASILALRGNTFGSSPTYAIMSSIMTEGEWSLASFIVVLIAVVCWSGGNHHLRVFQNALLMTWHGLIALCTFLSNPLSTGTGTYAVLAAAATLRAVHLAMYHPVRHYEA